MNPEVEAHLRSLVSFPTPPGVATQIIQLAKEPDIELSRVAKVLSMDSALGAKILRVANSPLYAQRRKSESLRQALVVLGLNATLTLALSFTLVKALRAAKSNGISHPFYWRRALLAATAARALADAMHHSLAEEIFLAALLQDIGILALDQALPDLYRGGEAVQRDHSALADMETRRLQMDHADIGGWLMGVWHLPERLQRAIARSHHIDPSFTADSERIFERCVALSGPVADLFLLDAGQRQFAEAAQSAERSLGFDKMAFGQVLATVGTMIHETEALFECDSLATHNPELILEQARDVLMLRSLSALREINSLRVAAQGMAVRTELEEESRRDVLTGTYNGAYLDQVLVRDFDNATRRKWPLSIAIADLDHFTRFNERFGRQAGDRVLQATARTLRGSTRETDLIARIGGEEFAVVLPATDAQTARAVCERMVAAFRSAAQAGGVEHTSVTISMGCATHGGDTLFSNAAEILHAAEQALRTAKASGRNRIVSFERSTGLTLAAGVG